MHGHIPYPYSRAPVEWDSTNLGMEDMFNTEISATQCQQDEIKIKKEKDNLFMNPSLGLLKVFDYVDYFFSSKYVSAILQWNLLTYYCFIPKRTKILRFIQIILI